MATMLGRLLLEAGDASRAQLDAALAEQRETGERIGQALVRGGLDPEVVARALSRQLRLGYAPHPLEPLPDALALVPRPAAVRCRAVPLEVDGRALRVAMVDPLDAAAIDDLQFRTGRRLEPLVATETTVERGLIRAYGDARAHEVLRRLDAREEGGGGRGGRAGGPGGRERTGEAAQAAEGGAAPGVDGRVDGDRSEDAALRQASEAPPIVALVDLILERATVAGASDIHVEPHGDRIRVRHRIDGVLRESLALPGSSGAAVVSRIKITAGLDIAVKRRPQDGRTAVTVGGSRVGVRVSTLPARGGEKVVLRILDSDGAHRSLDGLGMDEDLRAGLAAALDREHGLFLVTGPTGSGKSTTLYGILRSRDREGRNIVTLEDPVEYRLDGVTQVQVEPRAGLTFAAALRAVLRQDPDVVMVGEMRDRETAETGLAAALTGHLVLSTLHTNDAPGAVTRLAEMGAARYLVAGGLVGVLAQRLVRRLCPDCATIAPVSGNALYELGLPTPPHLPRAVGCDACGGTGFRGRVGVYELLRVDAPVRELILAGAPADAVREAASAAGSVSLAVDAWRKVEAGLTTLEEIRPLLTLLADEARACRSCGARIGRDQPFCPLCGGEVMRRCGCGAELRPVWRFCGACGDPVASPLGAGGRPAYPSNASETWRRSRPTDRAREGNR